MPTQDKHAVETPIAFLTLTTLLVTLTASKAALPESALELHLADFAWFHLNATLACTALEQWEQRRALLSFPTEPAAFPAPTALPVLANLLPAEPLQLAWLSSNKVQEDTASAAKTAKTVTTALEVNARPREHLPTLTARLPLALSLMRFALALLVPHTELASCPLLIPLDMPPLTTTGNHVSLRTSPVEPTTRTARLARAPSALFARLKEFLQLFRVD